MAYLNKLLYSPFFQNKFVLYGSLFAVLVTILRFLANRNFNGVILLTLIGVLMTYFSKNMIIVLLTAFISVTILDMLHIGGSIEGMKSSSKEGADTLKKTKKKSNTDENEEDDTENIEGEETLNKDTTAAAATPPPAADKPAADKPAVKSETTTATGESKPKTGSKQGMTQLSPANYDGKDHSAEKPGKNGNRIDYASTLEQAYDNIENIIGEDGVRGLTDQTKSLMNQQKQLMENMKDMGPLLKSAEGFMKQITGGGGIGGITEMLKGFAPAKAAAT
jgi:hypothetical protein